MSGKAAGVIAGLAILAGWAGADIVTINPDTPTGQNVGWNTAIWGDPAAVPTAGNDYIHNKNGVWLRALGPTYGSFAGDRLFVETGASVWFSGGGSLGGILVLDGGQIQNRSGINSVVLGNLRVISDSSILNIAGNLDLRTGLSGDGKLRISAFQTDGQKVTFNAIDSGFTGAFELGNAGADDRHLAVQFDRSYEQAGLTFQGGNLSRAPVYQLANDISFSSVSMPSASNSSALVELGIGTYDAAALSAAGVHAAYFNDLGGTITVIPEPATLGLVCFVGAAILAVRRISM